MRQNKNEIRKKYRNAIRANKPKEEVVHLATEYHRLVRKHNSLRKTKESLGTKDRLQKERQNYHKDQ